MCEHTNNIWFANAGRQFKLRGLWLLARRTFFHPSFKHQNNNQENKNVVRWNKINCSGWFFSGKKISTQPMLELYTNHLVGFSSNFRLNAMEQEQHKNLSHCKTKICNEHSFITMRFSIHMHISIQKVFNLSAENLVVQKFISTLEVRMIIILVNRSSLLHVFATLLGALWFVPAKNTRMSSLSIFLWTSRNYSITFIQKLCIRFFDLRLKENHFGLVNCGFCLFLT